MKITVFGANGRVGSLVVGKLVSRGHKVTAFVHGEPRQRLVGVSYVIGDIYDAADVSNAVKGANAVISCLGSWGTPNKDILTRGMQSIVQAMTEADIDRIISLTGADAWTASDHPNVLQKFMHTVFGILAGKILYDGEAHIRILADSRLAWTVLRSPVMNENGSDGYVLSNRYPKPWQTIHRSAVARALCDQLERYDLDTRTPYIVRR